MTSTLGRQHHRSLLTFYYSGFRQHSLCARRHGLGLREGSRLLDSKRWVFFSCCRAGFITFPRQISRLPTQYNIGGQPSKITKLQVLLRKGFHLQVRPDNSHGRSAKYAGDIYEPGFGGRLFSSLCRYWSFGSSCRAWLRPAPLCRHLLFDNSCRHLCHPCHKLFYGGGWTVTSLNRLAHHVPIISFPLINGVE
jgi:hypothetical protein